MASYSYTNRTNYLSSLDYGNGDSVDYTYDKQGRVTKETYEDGDTVTYKIMLHKARNSTIPNVAYSRMVNFTNTEQIYNAAPKWAKWLYTSPERAALIY